VCFSRSLELPSDDGGINVRAAGVSPGSFSGTFIATDM